MPRQKITPAGPAALAGPWPGLSIWTPNPSGWHRDGGRAGPSASSSGPGPASSLRIPQPPQAFSPPTQPSDAHSSAPAGARVTGCGLQPPSPGSRQAHSTWQPGEGRGSEAQPISSRPTSSVTPATPSFFISKRGAAITSTASICLQGGWGQGSGSRGSRQGGGRARGWGWGW